LAQKGLAYAKTYLLGKRQKFSAPFEEAGIGNVIIPTD
jgi:hypothetical protein